MESWTSTWMESWSHGQVTGHHSTADRHQLRHHTIQAYIHCTNQAQGCIIHRISLCIMYNTYIIPIMYCIIRIICIILPVLCTYREHTLLVGCRIVILYRTIGKLQVAGRHWCVKTGNLELQSGVFPTSSEFTRRHFFFYCITLKIDLLGSSLSLFILCALIMHMRRRAY